MIEWYRLDQGDYQIVDRVSGDATCGHPDFPGLVITGAPLWRLV